MGGMPTIFREKLPAYFTNGRCEFSEAGPCNEGRIGCSR